MIFIERIKSGQCIASMGTQLSEFVSVCVESESRKRRSC